MYIGLRVKYRLYLSDFNETWIFSTYFRQIFKYQIACKSVQWETSCSMNTDGQTDITKVVIAFPNFPNAAPKQEKLKCIAQLRFGIHAFCKCVIFDFEY